MTSGPSRDGASSRLPKMLRDEKYAGFKPISEFPDRSDSKGVKFGVLLAGAEPPNAFKFRFPFRKPLHSVIITNIGDGTRDLIVSETLLFSPCRVYSRILYEGRDCRKACEVAQQAEKDAAENPDTELFVEDGRRSAFNSAELERALTGAQRDYLNRNRDQLRADLQQASDIIRNGTMNDLAEFLSRRAPARAKVAHKRIRSKRGLEGNG